MKTVYHKASERGTANHGWLQANFSFSFANYYNPQKMNFGALRVLNDDFISGGAGFPTHPHSNMEIITIPLEGALEHKDSEGHTGVIYAGDVQVMSAGTGIYHSEYNHFPNKTSNTLQTWVIPREANVKPRYDQLSYSKEKKLNTLQQIVSPNENDDGLWVHQDTWYSIGEFESGNQLEYAMHKKSNGVYIFLISGSLNVHNESLNKRDAIGVWDTETVVVQVTEKSNVLLIEVPMGY